MTANPSQGWRTTPAPGAELQHTEAGRFALALEITHDGEHKGRSSVVFTGADIEALYRRMRQLHADALAADPDTSREHFGAGPDLLGFAADPDRSQLRAEMGRFT